jgi:D-psicose/D-tagatose/L-ribulose 3-epimerase
MIRYAINNWVYPDESFRTIFTRLAKFGYDGIELRGEPDTTSVSEIKALCQEFKLPVTGILGWGIYGIPGRDLASPDPAERGNALAYFKKCIDLAVAVAAPVVVVLPAAAGRIVPVGEPQTEVEWDRAAGIEYGLAVDAVRQLAAYAVGKPVTLAVEPINRFETYMINTLDKALKFLADVGAPNVKIHLDFYHANIDEADPAGAVRRAGKLLVNMHVADSNREPPGRGHTDWLGIMLALIDIGFDGAMAMEPVPPDAPPGLAVAFKKNLALRDTYAQECISYLKQVYLAASRK